MTKQLALMQEVIDMKTNVTMTHDTLNIGQECFLHWKKSLEFIVEIYVRSTNNLKDVHNLEQKIIEKDF